MKCRAPAQLALDAYAATVPLDDFLANHQSQPDTLLLSCHQRTASLKGPKQPLDLVGGDPRPLICDGHLGNAIVPRKPERDRTSRRRELHRVRDEICDDLLDLSRIDVRF